MNSDRTDTQTLTYQVPLAAPLSPCVQNLETANPKRQREIPSLSRWSDALSPNPKIQQTRPFDGSHAPVPIR